MKDIPDDDELKFRRKSSTSSGIVLKEMLEKSNPRICFIRKIFILMLVTDVGDNFKMSSTVLAILVSIIPFLIQRQSPKLNRCHQDLRIVANLKSPTSLSPTKRSVE